ncbi:YetF domain-containing protein [Neobacillus niacini]|uniref:YetF domain-containing protein n=1 Tax=Neobacillus niacini TaxID=86668 RepID=UPI003EBEAAA5
MIENGKLNEQNLTRLRLTVDQLEERIRNQGISKIEDTKTAVVATFLFCGGLRHMIFLIHKHK